VGRRLAVRLSRMGVQSLPFPKSKMDFRLAGC
jgi:hypothetical protein